MDWIIKVYDYIANNWAEVIGAALIMGFLGLIIALIAAAAHIGWNWV